MGQTVNNHKLALAYFGIPRSIGYTLASIEANVLGALPASVQIKKFAVFSREVALAHPETGETTELNPDDATKLTPDYLEQMEPWGHDQQTLFEKIQGFGDAWQNSFYSTKNLIKQLSTLKQVTARLLEEGYSNCLFLRPDLRYLDNMRPIYHHLESGSTTPICVLPKWGSAGGVNDLFSLCIGVKAVSAYGQRFDQVLDYCQSQNKPLHAERLLKFALTKAQVRIKPSGIRALRVRADGSTADQDFRADWLRRLLGN